MFSGIICELWHGRAHGQRNMFFFGGFFCFVVCGLKKEKGYTGCLIFSCYDCCVDSYYQFIVRSLLLACDYFILFESICMYAYKPLQRRGHVVCVGTCTYMYVL